MPRTRSVLLFILALLALDAMAVLLLRARRRPPPAAVDLEALRTGFTARVDAAARGAFLTTGRVFVTGTAKLAPDDLVLPSLDRRTVGDSLLVRIPGQVTYGFDITQLRRDSVQILPDGGMVVGVPPLVPARTTPFVDLLDVWTRQGWRRVPQMDSALAPATRARLHRALTEAASRVLESSRQPRIFSAHLLEGMLAPAARAAGEPRPRMRFRFSTAPRVAPNPSSTPP